MHTTLAYHITWTAYGTWLHGDSRGWVLSGVPCVQPADECLRQSALQKMTETAVKFDHDQRAILVRTIEAHCQLRDWVLHARSAQSNHVHVIVRADAKPELVMNQLKAWCSRKLSDAAGLAHTNGAKNAGRRKWFTEHGSTRWINNDDYFRSAIRYVCEGQ